MKSFALLVLFLSGLATPAFATPAAVYETVISRDSQPSWTVANGDSWMPESYRVRLTITTTFPVVPTSTTAPECVSHHIGGRQTCSDTENETRISAQIGTVKEELWRQLPDGSETQIGEARTLPINVEFDASPRSEAQAAVKFSDNPVLTAPASTDGRDFEMWFGNPVLWYLPIQTQVDSQGRITSLTGTTLSDELQASWQIDAGISVLYYGNATLKHLK